MHRPDRSLDLELTARSRVELSISIRRIQVGCGSRKSSRDSALGVRYICTEGKSMGREKRGFKIRDTDRPGDVLVSDW